MLGGLVIAAIDNGMGLQGYSAAAKYVVTALVLLAAVDHRRPRPEGPHRRRLTGDAPGADAPRRLHPPTGRVDMATQSKNLLVEFKDFIIRGNVVDLAVAVVIGLAFGNVVNALVRDIITPIVAAIFGKPDFGSLFFRIHKSAFAYGDFINNVITFVTIAAAIFFFVVKPINWLLERRRRAMAAGAPADEAAISEEAALLMEIRDLLRQQRPA